MFVAIVATVAVHVGHITSAVHVACMGAADGISIAAVAGSGIGVLVSLGVAVTVPGLVAVIVCVLVLMGTCVVVTVPVLVGGGVKDGAAVDSGTSVTGLVGFGLGVLVGIGTTV